MIAIGRAFWISAIALGLLAGGNALSRPHYPPPFPRPGVSKSFENGRVIVWQGLVGFKGRPTVMHEHTMDQVAVFFDDGVRVRTTMLDGTTRESATPTQRGAVSFQPKGVIHIEEVLNDGLRAVAIELKPQNRQTLQEPSGSAAAGPLLGRDGATLRLDNARVVIWDDQWPAGRPVPSVVHTRDSVIVPLESGSVRRTMANGTIRVIELAFGDPMFIPRGEVAREDVLKGSPRAIIVELK